MNKRSRSRTRRASLLFFTAFLAVLIAAAATGLWHTHSSAAEAAACTVCHVGTTPAQPQPASISLAPPVFMVEGPVVIPALSGGSAPIFSSKSPRAPPLAS
jgi:hypothetical protein